MVESVEIEISCASQKLFQSLDRFNEHLLEAQQKMEMILNLQRQQLGIRLDAMDHLDAWYRNWEEYFGFNFGGSSSNLHSTLSIHLQHIIDGLEQRTSRRIFADVQNRGTLLPYLQRGMSLLPYILRESKYVSYHYAMELIDVYRLCIYCSDLISIEQGGDICGALDRRAEYYDCMKYWGVYDEGMCEQKDNGLVGFQGEVTNASVKPENFENLDDMVIEHSSEIDEVENSNSSDLVLATEVMQCTSTTPSADLEEVDEILEDIYKLFDIMPDSEILLQRNHISPGQPIGDGTSLRSSSALNFKFPRLNSYGSANIWIWPTVFYDMPCLRDYGQENLSINMFQAVSIRSIKDFMLDGCLCFYAIVFDRGRNMIKESSTSIEVEELNANSMVNVFMFQESQLDLDFHESMSCLSNISTNRSPAIHGVHNNYGASGCKIWCPRIEGIIIHPSTTLGTQCSYGTGSSSECFGATSSYFPVEWKLVNALDQFHLKNTTKIHVDTCLYLHGDFKINVERCWHTHWDPIIEDWIIEEMFLDLHYFSWGDSELVRKIQLSVGQRNRKSYDFTLRNMLTEETSCYNLLELERDTWEVNYSDPLLMRQPEARGGSTRLHSFNGSTSKEVYHRDMSSTWFDIIWGIFGHKKPFDMKLRDGFLDSLLDWGIFTGDKRLRCMYRCIRYYCSVCSVPILREPILSGPKISEVKMADASPLVIFVTRREQIMLDAIEELFNHGSHCYGNFNFGLEQREEYRFMVYFKVFLIGQVFDGHMSVHLSGVVIKRKCEDEKLLNMRTTRVSCTKLRTFSRNIDPCPLSSEIFMAAESLGKSGATQVVFRSHNEAISLSSWNLLNNVHFYLRWSYELFGRIAYHLQLPGLVGYKYFAFNEISVWKVDDSNERFEEYKSDKKYTHHENLGIQRKLEEVTEISNLNKLRHARSEPGNKGGISCIERNWECWIIVLRLVGEKGKRRDITGIWNCTFQQAYLGAKAIELLESNYQTKERLGSSSIGYALCILVIMHAHSFVSSLKVTRRIIYYGGAPSSWELITCLTSTSSESLTIFHEIRTLFAISSSRIWDPGGFHIQKNSKAEEVTVALRTRQI